MNWVGMCLVAGGLVLTGCGKPQKPAPMVVVGVTVDLPKLKEAFAAASPEVQTSVSEVAMGLRYDDYPRCFAALAKLDSAPGSTEPQKKIVGEVTEQIKQLATKAAAPPAR